PETCEALRGPDWWAFAISERLPAPITSAASRRLSAALSRTLDPIPTGSVIIDDQLGRDFPRTPLELVSACLRIGVRELRLCGRLLRLQGPARVALEDRLLVRRASAVDRVVSTGEGATVTFRRYRSPRSLRGPLAMLVKTLADHSATVGQLREQAS